MTDCNAFNQIKPTPAPLGNMTMVLKIIFLFPYLI